MPSGGMARIIRQLRRAALLQDGSGLSDAELLDAFLCRGDDAALEALIRRHGPLVMGVCRRLLGNVHDAADAFQAVFLVFVQKARSIRSPAALVAWLYGVAYRISLKARGRRQKRQTREASVASVPEQGAEIEVPADDLLALLDEEVNSLPEKYRVPVICNTFGVQLHASLPPHPLRAFLDSSRNWLSLSFSGG